MMNFFKKSYSSKVVLIASIIGGVLGVYFFMAADKPYKIDQYSSNSVKNEQSKSHRNTGKISDKFPNIVLQTQHGQFVHFYDDLVKDKTVIINFMYTRCDGICGPSTFNLRKVYKELGNRVGKSTVMLSISLDPANDSPENLRKYIELHGGEKKGWLYLTGDYDEIDDLRHTLGVYDPDPIIDANKSEHSGLVTFGSDTTNFWSALPALMKSEEIAETILRLTRDRSHGYKPYRNSI